MDSYWQSSLHIFEGLWPLYDWNNAIYHVSLTYIYICSSSNGKGLSTCVDILLGPDAGDVVQVRTGLNEGECPQTPMTKNHSSQYEGIILRQQINVSNCQAGEKC